MNKISVIIPVFNVENYLTQCLDSIIHQTYSNLEIICINDGSTDNSAAILASYAKTDSRIIVINQENSGAGAARNRALDMASGEFIGFVDADDWISERFYESLLNSIESTGSEIAGCEVNVAYKNNCFSTETASSDRQDSFSSEEVLLKSLNHWKYYIVVNKLFRASIIKDTKFPVGNIIDDGFFTYRIIGNANHVSWINDALYFYRQRSTSVMNNSNYLSIRAKNEVELLNERLSYILQYHPQLYLPFEKKIIDSYITIVKHKAINKDLREKCRHELFSKHFLQTFKVYSGKERFVIQMYILFPNLTNLLFKTLYKDIPESSFILFD